MSLALKRVKVYLRVAIVAVIVGAIAIVLIKNRNHRVSFWFFGLLDEHRQVNVVLLIWVVAGTTLLVARIVWFMRGLIRDMREVKQLNATKALEEQHRRRAAELAERERKFNEKLAALTPPDLPGEKNHTSAQGGAT